MGSISSSKVIEKVQAELRNEYDIRAERKRELEFLEKGGNPLDFAFGTSMSVSVQSTSFPNHHHGLVTSEAKGSFACTASLHGDSVESSGGPAAPSCEPNIADNLMLFDAECEHSEDRSCFHPIRSNTVPLGQFTEMDENHKTRESGDSVAPGLPRKAYKRRHRSSSNRDGVWSSSNSVNLALGCHGSSLHSRHGTRDVVELKYDVVNLDISSNRCFNPRSPTDNSLASDDHRDVNMDGVKAVESTEHLISDAVSDAIASNNPLDQINQPSLTDDTKTPINSDYDHPAAFQVVKVMVSTDIGLHSNVTAVKVENQSSYCQVNGLIDKRGDKTTRCAHNSHGAIGRNGFDFESCCSHVNTTIDGNNDAETCNKIRAMVLKKNIDKQSLTVHSTQDIEGDDTVKEKNDENAIANFTVDDHSASACKLHMQNGSFSQSLEESSQGKFDDNKLKNQFDNEGLKADGCTGSESRMKSRVLFDNDPYSQDEICCMDANKRSVDNSNSDLSVESSKKFAAASDKIQNLGCNVEIASMDEDSILKEAKIIQAKRKRIAELSNLTFPLEMHHKSHWGFVLEEMEWLANDFAQERLWKLAATSQICNQAALRYWAKKQEKSSDTMAKVVAHTLAKAVMEFWHSAENTSKEMGEPIQKDGAHTIQSYAIRYLKYNNSNDLHIHDEMSITPEKISETETLDTLDISWESNLSEEILFYNVTCGSMETYRHLVESHVAHHERSGSNLQYEVDASACVKADNLYFEDEDETRPYSMSVAFDDSNFAKFGRKRQRQSAHTYISRTYETDSDLLPIQCEENKILALQSALLTKRPGNNLNVSIPTKRVRTSSRRIVSPFSTGTSGFIQVSNKMDASSGDTNSFEDYQSTLCGGSFAQNNLDVESCGEFEKNLPFNSAEVYTKPKKKKKAKHLSSAIEDSWQVDSNFYEQFQRDRLKKRPECYQRGSNGFDGGPTPSPVASQKNYASHPNKFYKILSCRERGKKPKMKMPAGLPGSGIPWSLFEDQALVVMVHDMGPNWELVSDAFNSTLQFKCIFRQAKECKERHSTLMDRTSGDLVDNADNSGSSQHYPSTLPGIPKGSARQLFQHLKEPMEDDTLRSHREKIIMIGQKLKYRKNQDPRQLQQPHDSHTSVLSKVCPNNLSGGSVLSPLDLCDAVSDPERLPLGDQGTFSRGSTIPNHGAGTLMLPASSSALQGSPNMVIVNGFPSSSGPLNSPVKVSRYVVPRTTLSTDEQQRMLQYNQTVSGRSSPQSSVSAPGVMPGIDRGGRVLSGGNGAGMVSISRNVPLTRPGCQGIVSSPVVNPVSIVSPGMVSENMLSGVASGQGNPTLRPREALQMMRPSLTQDSQRSMMVPDHQTQFSPRTSSGMSHFGGFNSHFSNQTASLPLPSYPIHLQQSNSLTLQQPQGPSPQHSHFQGSTNGAPSPQKQDYAIRLAKERQIQHQFLQHQSHQKQQQQVAASSSSMSHVRAPPHLPESSLIQNSPLAPSQASSPEVSYSPLTSASSMTAMPQQQQKHQTPAQRFNCNAQAGGNGLTNPTSKHRQRQQQSVSQSNRQHLQQRPQAPSQQQAKNVKWVDRGSLMVHHDVPIDSSLLNGVLTDMGNEKLDKGVPVVSLGETEDPYASSSLKTAVHGSKCMPSQSSKQFLSEQKKYSVHETLSSKHLHQMISHSDSSSGHNLPLAPAPDMSSAHQSVSPSAMAASMHQQLLSSGKSVNQNQSVSQRVVQPPHFQFNSESLHEANTDQSLIGNSIEMDATTSLPQTCNSANNGFKLVSAGIAHQWHASERLKDSNVLDPTRSLSSMVSNPENTSEPMPHAGQGLSRIPPSANLIPIKLDISSQWPQPSQIQQPHSPASPMVAVNSASPGKE